LAKIAVELERALALRAVAGAPGRAESRLLAQGNGWSVSDVVCTSGPRDRPFEERHSRFCIAIVAAGTFQYRSDCQSGTRPELAPRELMTPGSLFLGNAGRSFECGHEHGRGDRCVSFGYAPEYFERLAADAGTRGGKLGFRTLRLPPLRSLSPLLARAGFGLTCSSLNGSGYAPGEVPWEEISVQLAAQVVQLSGGFLPNPISAPPSAVARVTRAVRKIEHHTDGDLTLGSLAREAGLSPYHFLRTFVSLAGVTPHQYVLRARLRAAAMRLAIEPAKVLDIALDCGFGDVSNFNRAFRTEFQVSPRVYRRQTDGVASRV
jgi:AraC family transcriptional regulator